MDLQTPREGLYRREEPLLQADHQQTRGRLRAPRGAGEALLAEAAVLIEQAREHKFGRIVMEVVNDYALDDPLRKAALHLADVFLKPTDHHILERLLPAHFHSARETVGIEQLQQSREAVRVAIVRRRRQEEPVFEASGKVAHRARELRLDAVAAAAGRRGVMRFVDDQEAPRQEWPQPLAQGIRIGRIDEQIMRDEEPAVRAPGIDAEAALAPHARKIRAVENLEEEAEAILQLTLPLLEHRRGRGDDNRLRLLAQEQLTRNEARLDGLAETRVVGDEEVDARQAQRLAQRLHLVGVDLDPGAKRRLEEVRVGGGDAVPAQRVEEGREVPGRIESPRGEILPALLFQDPAVDLIVPVDIERLALGIVIGTGKAHETGVPRGIGLDPLLNEPSARPDFHQFAGLGWTFGEPLC